MTMTWYKREKRFIVTDAYKNISCLGWPKGKVHFGDTFLSNHDRPMREHFVSEYMQRDVEIEKEGRRIVWDKRVPGKNTQDTGWAEWCHSRWGWDRGVGNGCEVVGGTHNRWGDGTQHVEQEYDDGGKNNTTNTSKI